MAEVALTFNIRQEPDGTTVVRAPDGRVVATCPDSVAGGWFLGILRLAAWAHRELRDRPLELYQVLQVDPVIGEAERVVEATASLLGPDGRALL